MVNPGNWSLLIQIGCVTTHTHTHTHTRRSQRKCVHTHLCTTHQEPGWVPSPTMSSFTVRVARWHTRFEPMGLGGNPLVKTQFPPNKSKKYPSGGEPTWSATYFQHAKTMRCSGSETRTAQVGSGHPPRGQPDLSFGIQGTKGQRTAFLMWPDPILCQVIVSALAQVALHVDFAKAR